MSLIGAVAIGRNEGDRLRLCLESLVGRCAAVVYVDSGSTDGSIALARSLGVEVVDLDRSTPFTAARARNAGFDRLLEVAPDIAYVQFVDGDCEVVEGWLDRAQKELESRPDAAVVCGRRRERYPDRSIYNRLADLEWDTPIGEAKACGGDALMRKEAVLQVGGYNPATIAAEDDEICLKIRAEGWKVLRIDNEMTLHDMAMTRFGQWWKRSVRTGYAYVNGATHYGRTPDRHFVRQTLSVVAWGILLPTVSLALIWPTRGLSLILLAAYPVLFARIRRRIGQSKAEAAYAAKFAWLFTIGKFPQAWGIAKYLVDRIFGRRSGIIEYRSRTMQGEVAR